MDEPWTKEEREEAVSKIIEISRRKESVVDYLTRWLAIGMISYWLSAKSTKKYKISREQALKLLDFGASSGESGDDIKNGSGLFKSLQESYIDDDDRELDVFEELENKLKAFSKNISVDIESGESLTYFFDGLEGLLRNWYSLNNKSEGYLSCLYRLRINAKKMKLESNQKLQSLMKLLLTHSSIRHNFNLLTQLEESLSSLKEEYMAHRQKFEQQQKGCYDCYQKNLTTNYAWARKSIWGFYQYKIKTQIYNLAAQIITNTLLDLVAYKELLEESDCFLSELKSALMADALMRGENDYRIFLIPFLEAPADNPDLIALSKAVEDKVGYSVYAWGRSHAVTLELVQKTLLEEARPIVANLCLDFREKLEREFS